MTSNGVELRRAVSASELAAKFGGTLRDAQSESRLTRVVRPLDAQLATDLVVLSSARWVELARSVSGLVLCPPELASALPNVPCWVHEYPSFALAQLLTELARAAAERDATSSHSELGPSSAAPQARVSPRAVLGQRVTIEPGAVVLSGARIADGCHLGANSVIYGGVVLGCRVRVGAGSVIGSEGFGIATGPHGATQRIPQLAGVVIEADVQLGALCSVDAGTLSPTRIGRESRLDAQVHVGHNVCLGSRVIVAAQVGFGGSTEVGDDVLVGGQVGVADHVRIGRGARLAARSGVIGDVQPNAVVAGYPAMPKGEWLRSVGWVRRQVLELRGHTRR